MTMQEISLQPEFTQMLTAAQQGKLPDEDGDKAEAAPALSVQKTLQVILERTKKLAIDQLGKQAEMEQKAQSGFKSEMDLMIDMFVEVAKADDELFDKHGVRNDEVEMSIMHYMAEGYPEIQAAMTQYMTDMQAEMHKQGGGGTAI